MELMSPGRSLPRTCNEHCKAKVMPAIRYCFVQVSLAADVRSVVYCDSRKYSTKSGQSGLVVRLVDVKWSQDGKSNYVSLFNN